MKKKQENVSFAFDNGVTVELKLGAGREVLGIGRVRAGNDNASTSICACPRAACPAKLPSEDAERSGYLADQADEGKGGPAAQRAGKVDLRNGGIPLRPWIRSVNGVQYTSFRLRGIKRLKNGGVDVLTTAVGHPCNETAYGDEYNDHQFRVAERDPAREDSLTWELRPASLALDGLRYEGFSYSWSFSSKTEKLYRIVSVGTWEIGGKATGNTILSQGQITPAVYTARKSTRFTSACLKALRDFGKPLNMSFQWNHRWCPHQCFDFLASDKGSLLGYWPGKADVRSFVQKNPGEDVFFVADATHFKAVGSVKIPAKCVLFAPAGSSGRLPEHEMRDRWFSAYQRCTDLVRRRFRVKPSRPLPECQFPYGQRLEKDGRFMMRVGAKWVPSQEWLIAIADDVLPEAAKRGFRRVITEPISESDPTERGLIRKLDRGIHGDLNVGSCCCTHRYRPAEFFGGMKAWRYYYNKAHSLGLQVGHWTGGHLSYHAPILKEHPEWALKAFTSLTFAGGYPNFELASLNMNTGAAQWILDDLERWKEEGGLDYIWFDSLGNLDFLPLDYDRDMEPNGLALARFFAGLQKIGIADIVVEGVSPLGMSGCHIQDVDPVKEGGVQWIAGQNCWEWFEGNEDMLTGQQPRPGVHAARTDESVRKRFFRALASRCVLALSPYLGPGLEEREWHKRYLDAYFAVESDMASRRLLPNRQGVLWLNGRKRVLFTFEKFELDIGVQAAIDMAQGGRAVACGDNGVLKAKAWCVYRWTE